MNRTIGSVELRHKHEVYETKDNYYVHSPKGSEGDIVVKKYRKEIIEAFHGLFHGRNLSREEAQNMIASSELKRFLKYQYGHLQQYEVQDILVCLVVTGRGNYHKEGKKYIYEIK